MRSYTIITIILFLVACKTSKVQRTDEVLDKLGDNPYYEVDGQPKTKSEFAETNPESIATLTILYQKSAVNLYGNTARDGAVIIETKTIAKQKFQALFSELSSDYAELLIQKGTDESFIYVVNGEVKEHDYEGDLSTLKPSEVESIGVLELKDSKIYCVDETKTVVVVQTKNKK